MTKDPTEAAGVRDESAMPQTEEEWRERLGAERYEILRRHGTERAFTGELWNLKGEGLYRCAGCGEGLFPSDTKFDSGTGWPSFWAPVEGGPVETKRDWSWGMVRTEVHCGRCEGHLGHVFKDGPKPTGQRYCINSLSLTFEPGTVEGDS